MRTKTRFANPPQNPLMGLIRGFTLIEMLLYVGLLSIFLFVLTDLFVSSFDLKLESEATSSVEQDGRFILERFEYDLARADTVLVPASASESGSVLSLDMGGVVHSYTLLSDNIFLSDSTNSDQLNSNRVKVNSILFERVGNETDKDTIRFEFNIESIDLRKKGAEVRDFQTAAGIR